MHVCVCVFLVQVVCQFLCKEATEALTEKQFIPAVRKFIIKHLLAGLSLSLSTFSNGLFLYFYLNVSQNKLILCCVCYPGRLRYTEVLSSDLQKNSLAALLRLGAVRKIKGYVGFDHPCVPGWLHSLKQQLTKMETQAENTTLQ